MMFQRLLQYKTLTIHLAGTLFVVVVFGLVGWQVMSASNDSSTTKAPSTHAAANSGTTSKSGSGSAKVAAKSPSQTTPPGQTTASTKPAASSSKTSQPASKSSKAAKPSTSGSSSNSTSSSGSSSIAPAASNALPPPSGFAYSCSHVWPSDDDRCSFNSDSYITSTTGTITSGPWVDQNVWSGNESYLQTNYVASPESWVVDANANTGWGGVQTYPNTGWGSEGPGGSMVTVDSESSITSSWNVTIPTDTTKVAGWAGYDLWFNHWADEVMIQPDITAPSYYNCDAVVTATFSGMPWHMCAFGSERVWKPGTDDQHLQNLPSGSIDVKAFLTYMENNMTTAQDKLPANSGWTGGSFGFEICDTHGTNQFFKVNSFTWHEQ